MGENNHGIEPESSEQGTFSKNHLKTGSIEKPKVKDIKNKNWTRIVAQENKEIYRKLVWYRRPKKMKYVNNKT